MPPMNVVYSFLTVFDDMPKAIFVMETIAQIVKDGRTYKNNYQSNHPLGQRPLFENQSILIGPFCVNIQKHHLTHTLIYINIFLVVFCFHLCTGILDFLFDFFLFGLFLPLFGIYRHFLRIFMGVWIFVVKFLNCV